jgi:hypothetical protein
MSAMYTTPIAKNRFSQERFPLALKGLMEERHLSYRQLAYKTKPVPADPVLAVLAEALCVEPDFFVEFRLRQVAGVLDDAPALADKLYGILLRKLPVPDDIGESLSHPHNGGGNGHAQTAAVGF